MGCYRCGRRQSDPARGQRPWGRLVVDRKQLLICPDCQMADKDWTREADKCGACGSTRLSVVMDSVVCRECGEIAG